MLSQNIRALRRAKGLSQEALAAKLHVVRQTVSKWEQGLSAPDAELLIALGDALDTPVSTLLGQPVIEAQPDDLSNLAQKLEGINRQLARQKAARQRALHWFCIALCVLVAAGFAVMIGLGSPYLAWDYRQPEMAVAGTLLHAVEWVFVRLAPLMSIGACLGAYATRRKEG